MWFLQDIEKSETVKIVENTSLSLTVALSAMLGICLYELYANFVSHNADDLKVVENADDKSTQTSCLYQTQSHFPLKSVIYDYDSESDSDSGLD